MTASNTLPNDKSANKGENFSAFGLILLLAGVMLYFLFIHKVVPVSSSDPQIIRLKAFADANHLEWKVSISSDGMFYCASLNNPESWEFLSRCQPFLSSAVSEAISARSEGSGRTFAGGKND